MTELHNHKNEPLPLVTTTNPLLSERKTFPRWALEPKFLEADLPLGKVYSMSIEEVKNVKLAVERIYELYELFGKKATQQDKSWFCNKNVNRQERRETLRANWDLYNSTHSLLRVVSKNGEGSWAKILKWKFAAFFSFHRKEEIPPRPEVVKDPCPVYNRAVRKWLSKPCNLLNGFCKEMLEALRSESEDFFLEFADTVQQLKKGMPSVPESMIDSAIDKTVKQLTVKKDDIVLPDVDFFPINREWGCDLPLVDCSKDMIIAQLQRTVRELFGSFKPSYEDFIEPFFPSTSANYINSRAKGGAVGTLYHEFNLGMEGSLLDEGILTGGFRTKIPQMFFTQGQKEKRDFQKEEDLLGCELIEENSFVIYDDTRLRSRWASLYRDIFKRALVERPEVSPVGLSEPLKVRVISKGPPLTYTVLKPLQRLLWAQLKKHQVFALIGRYVLPEDIDNCIGKLKEDEIAVSGDYVASTDNLHSWTSEAICEEIMNCFNSNVSSEELALYPKNFFRDLRLLILKALTGHVFKHKGELHDQVEGQLMGSIISFPFLCIANAALCRYAMEVSNSENYSLVRKSNLAPLLVNGDDCLFKGLKSRIRSVWETVTANAGLQSSVGKTYFSRDFCTINSTIFSFKSSWVERKYINLGLLHGQKRSAATGSSSCHQYSQLGVLCRELKRSCPPRLWANVKRKFIQLNNIELKKFNVPWMVPEWLGGLGLPQDTHDEISDLDRRSCTVIKNRMLHDKNFEVIKQSQCAQWKQHKLVLQRLDQAGIKPVFFENCDVLGKTYKLEESFSSTYKLLTIDLLFSCPLEGLIEQKDVAGRRAAQVNERAYRNAIAYIAKSDRMAARDSSIESVQMMSDDEMADEKKEIFYPVAIGELPPYGGPCLGKTGGRS